MSSISVEFGDTSLLLREKETDNSAGTRDEELLGLITETFWGDSSGSSSPVLIACGMTTKHSVRMKI